MSLRPGLNVDLSMCRTKFNFKADWVSIDAVVFVDWSCRLELHKIDSGSNVDLITRRTKFINNSKVCFSRDLSSLQSRRSVYLGILASERGAKRGQERCGVSPFSDRARPKHSYKSKRGPALQATILVFLPFFPLDWSAGDQIKTIIRVRVMELASNGVLWNRANASCFNGVRYSCDMKCQRMGYDPGSTTRPH